MSVAHDAESESTTGTTGHASVPSHTWNHVPTGTPRAALVFVVTIAGTPVETSVTYGGVTMTKVAYDARASSAEPGSVTAYFLDNVATGTQAVVVNRTNNATVDYAAAFSVTAAGACEVYEAGIATRAGSTANTGASSTGTDTGVSGESAVDDGSPGTSSQRYMGYYCGGSNVLAAGSNSTAGPSIDFGLFTFATYRETTPGQGSRNVGSVTGTTDDRAMVALAIREVPTVVPRVPFSRPYTQALAH